ncbi:hypothetical protein [Acinetobacter venetianus]|uniref:hypothetical protein n=1 Tax=Acinetobacter venetianus TaxID=52133 RepID=UPI00241C41AB|nr:hypothetical protein [Acinetobacter venetianus]
MTLQGLIIAVLGITLAFVSYLYVDYKKTGGYERNTDGYYGYSFPSDNGLTKATDCNQAITNFPNEKPPSKEWMEGCQKYFEIN